MTKSLVIVESAAKAKTIQKYLGDSFVVIASLGHINDLPKKTLGVDKATWEATYQLSSEKANIVKKLRSAAKDAEKIYLATDPDMEGEAIAYHLAATLKLKNPVRIMFREITRDALRHAMAHPTRIDDNLVSAQEARRILDRVVGYELSPLLWKQFADSNLSAGRVQSAALKILVDNLIDARRHTPVPYWKLHGDFVLDGGNTGVKASSMQHDSEQDALQSLKHVVRFANSQWKAHVHINESKRHPSAPFVTSSLQQEAYNKLGVSAKRTMQEAQSLYEDGYITYMRTDSPALSAQAQHEITEYIKKKYGDEDVTPRQYKAKAANAQHAHECIRPTKVSASPALDGVRGRLYELIWRRAVASQMKSATFLEAHIEFTCDGVQHVFRGKHEMLVDEGYLKVWSPDTKRVSDDEIRTWKTRTILGANPVSFAAVGDVSRPPTLFNEPMLVRTLEKMGIGRPSTYATTLDKLVSKGYVAKGAAPHASNAKVHSFTWEKSRGSIQQTSTMIDIAKNEKDRLVPTDLGERVTDYLMNITPDIVDAGFTSQMETALDQISDGQANKRDVLHTFYTAFQNAISSVQRCPCLGVEVKQTKYGLALFRSLDNTYISLTPFLAWKKRTANDLTERDVSFLLSLPRSVAGTTRTIAYGRYGLYIKDGSKNIRLDKKYWDAVYSETLDPQVIVSARAV